MCMRMANRNSQSRKLDTFKTNRKMYTLRSLHTLFRKFQMCDQIKHYCDLLSKQSVRVWCVLYAALSFMHTNSFKFSLSALRLELMAETSIEYTSNNDWLGIAHNKS